jgi:hypothetical protein
VLVSGPENGLKEADRNAVKRRNAVYDYDLGPEDYNYRIFSHKAVAPEFMSFMGTGIKVGDRIAADYVLEDLDSGEKKAMKDLWKSGLALLEFGSFT